MLHPSHLVGTPLGCSFLLLKLDTHRAGRKAEIYLKPRNCFMPSENEGRKHTAISASRRRDSSTPEKENEKSVEENPSKERANILFGISLGKWKDNTKAEENPNPIKYKKPHQKNPKTHTNPTKKIQ